MKKLLSLILSAAMILTSFLTISVAAANEVEVSSIAYSFEVTVRTAETDRVTLKIFPLTKESDGSFTKGNVPLHIGQANAPDPLEPASTYKLSGSFLRTVGTGWYRAETNKGYKDFYYVNPLEKVALYKEIKNAADAAAVETAITNGITNGAVDFDYGNYLTYDATRVRKHINSAILNIEGLPSDLGDAPTNTDIKTYITSFEAVFKPEFSDLIEKAEFVASGSTEDFIAEVTAQATELGLDLTYYSQPALAPAATVYSCFSKLSPADFSDTAINDMFDTAVLLAVIKSAQDFGKVTAALDYYDNDSNSTCISLDKQYTTDYGENEFNQLSEKLQLAAADINSAKDIEDKYLELSTPSTDNPGGDVGGNPGAAPAAPPAGGNNSQGAKPESGELSDLGEAEWAKEAVEALVKEGVLAGKGDGKFYPNDTVTREEFIKIIAEAFELTDESADAEFSDVSSNRWSYKYIASGYSAGIITGTSEKEFNPAGEMTRENMAVIIYRVAQYLGYELSDDDGADFADITDVADYAKDAVKALCATGVINGTGNNMFSPKGIVTRAQAAKIVYELLVAMGGIK